MTAAEVDDFNERVALCRESGVNLERAIAIATAQLRAREVAALPREGVVPASGAAGQVSGRLQMGEAPTGGRRRV